MADSIKIVVGGDSSGFTQAARAASASASQLNTVLTDVADASSRTSGAIENTASSFAEAAKSAAASASAFKSAFDEVAAGEAALNRINAAIDASASAALNAGQKFDSLGGRLPLQDFNEFKKSVDQFKKDISSGFKFNFPPKPIPPDLPNNLNNSAKASNTAAAALLGLSRVAQDAPFGFAAISNNITELPGAFQRLSASAKESGQSIGKLLLASLTGPAGIGVALSAVTAAVTFASVGFGAWTRGFSKTSEAINKQKKEIDDFISSLKSVDQVTKEAAASQDGQIAQVQALAGVVSDSNKPYAQRKRALEELKEVNKSYFGDLKLEDAATGKLAETVNKYADALVNAAIQKEFASDIANIAKEVVKQDAIIQASRNKVAQAQGDVTDAENKLARAVDKRITSEGQSNQIIILTDKLRAAKGKLADADEELSKENSKVTTLLVQEALTRDQLNKAVAEGTKMKDLDSKVSKKEEDLLKKRLEALEKIQETTKDASTRVGLQELIFDLQVKIALRDQGKNQLSKGEVEQQINGFKTTLQKEFQNQALELELSPKVHFSQVVRTDISTKDISSEIAKATGLDKKIPIPTDFEINARLFGIKFALAEENKKKIKEQLNQQVTSILSGVQVDAVGSIGEALGNAVAGSTNIFGSLFDVLANGLVQFGKALIAYGIALKGFKLAIKSLNPVAAILAGVGAIAAGTILKAAVPKFADGGVVNGPTFGLVGERGPEVIAPLRKLPGIINDTLKLSLPKLLGSINVTGDQPIVFNGGFRVSGTDLSLMLERVQGRRSRLG